MVVLIAVYSTTFNISMRQLETCEQATSGRVRVIGIDNSDAIAGRTEICYNGWWRAVCAGGWDVNDAEVVCRQMLNLSQSEEILVQVCTDLCYGKSFLTRGIRWFGCTGTESTLIDCTNTNYNTEKCHQDAGFVCYKRPKEATCPIMTQCTTVPIDAEEHTICPPLECDCTCPSTEINNTECPTPGTQNTGNTEGGRNEQQKTETVTCTALGGGLGTLVAVLILILVGVVLGWVWSCHRNINETKQQDTMHDNPAYGTIPPISHDPEDGMSPPTLTLNTSVTPPIYATINENTSKKCSDGVGMKYQVVDDPGVYI